MVKNLVCILALSVMIPASIAAQYAVTFRLEELSKPDGPLPTISYKDQLENLALSDAGI